MMPTTGQRVIVDTLHAGKGHRGMIVSVGLFGLGPSHGRYEICEVRLDSQERTIQGVRYYDAPPDLVDSTHWQICYPDTVSNTGRDGMGDQVPTEEIEGILYLLSRDAISSSSAEFWLKEYGPRVLSELLGYRRQASISRQTIEELRGVLWMAEKYAEGGGSSGLEMQEYSGVVAALAAYDAIKDEVSFSSAAFCCDGIPDYDASGSTLPTALNPDLLKGEIPDSYFWYPSSGPD